MKIEHKKRKQFLQAYTDFNNWLLKLGFESDKSYNSTHLDCHYSWYDNKIESLCSVEHYINKRLQISLRFLRDRNEHKFMVVGECGSHSELLSLDDFKKEIKDEVIRIRNEKLEELQYFNWL